MNFDGLIGIVEKQCRLYGSLYQLAEQKVEIIKKNDVPALNQMMKDEQKHVTAITILENERINEMKKLFPKDTANLPTIRDCIDLAESVQKTTLQNLYHQLNELLQKLKQKNDLNQELLKQSLQFVNFSLNMIQPKINTATYGPTTGRKQTNQSISSRSIFNSQA